MIYIVKGSTGAYSDRIDWPVRAFSTEERAKELVLALEEWCRLHGVHDESRDTIVNYFARGGHNLKCPLDPHFSCSYVGTRYYYYSVPLDDEGS